MPLCKQFQTLRHRKHENHIMKMLFTAMFWFEHASLYAKPKYLSNPFFKGKFRGFAPISPPSRPIVVAQNRFVPEGPEFPEI